METFESYINQMNQLLIELIQVATQLRDMSLQVISEEDLAPLQKHQEDLLSQLEAIDQFIQRDHRHQITAAIEEQIHKQLHMFQKLNQDFIQNLSTSHGLIQFELRRFEEQEGQDFSSLLRLNKISPPPDSSKTVKSEENE